MRELRHTEVMVNAIYKTRVLLMTGQWEISVLSGRSKRMKWGKKLRSFFYALNKNYERQLNKSKFLFLNFVTLACSIFKISFIIHILDDLPTAST